MSKRITPVYRYTSHWPQNRPGPTAVEQRLGEILDAWMGTNKFTKKDEDKYKDALKQALKGFLKTPQGKKLNDVLLSAKVLPLTLMIVGTALTGIIVNKRDIPSVPEISLLVTPIATLLRHG